MLSGFQTIPTKGKLVVAEGAGITLCAAFSSRLINQPTEAYFFCFFATVLEDGEIGEEFE